VRTGRGECSPDGREKSADAAHLHDLPAARGEPPEAEPGVFSLEGRVLKKCQRRPRRNALEQPQRTAEGGNAASVFMIAVTNSTAS